MGTFAQHKTGGWEGGRGGGVREGWQMSVDVTQRVQDMFSQRGRDKRHCVSSRSVKPLTQGPNSSDKHDVCGEGDKKRRRSLQLAHVQRADKRWQSGPGCCLSRAIGSLKHGWSQM